MYQLLSKIGKLLFHRMGVMFTLIAAQIVLYVLGLLWLQDTQYYGVYWGIALTLSVLAVLWIVGNSSNPGYKIGWIIIVLALIPFGSLAYLLLGGNHLSWFNQRRLRTMERRMRQQLGGECDKSSSLALLEGMSLGLPSIVSDYGGNHYLIENGVNGLLFPSQDSQALSRCMARLMDHPNEVKRMGQRARERFNERFTGPVFARNIERIYQNVRKGAPHGTK